MREGHKVVPAIEPERYEFSAAPAYQFELARRDFFKLAGGGIVILFSLRDARAQQESGAAHRQTESNPPQLLSAWLHIGEDGGVTVFTGKVEMGQNVRTSLTQAVAEELRVPPSIIRMVMGDTELTPYDVGTFGSRTTPMMNLQLRRAAAAARGVLIQIAANQWNVDAQRLVAAEGRIADPATQRSSGYGELVAGKELVTTIHNEVPLEPASQWTVAGKSLPKVDGRALVTGRHRYTSDQKLPGMLYGKVVRPSAFEATLVSADAKDAEAISGVTVVRDGSFLGVAAASEELAARAAVAIRAEWRTTPQISNRELFDSLKKNALAGGPGGSQHETGNIQQGLAAAEHRLEQTYTVAFIAHAPLEPRAAVAEWSGDRLSVWTGTQRPFAVRSELAQAFRLPENRVRVRVPDTGSAYGGKHTGETAIEAARLARTAGRPVKVVWTREEEFTWAYFRPAGVIEVRSGTRADGRLVAWEFHNYNSGAAAIGTPYDVPNQRIEFHPVRSPLRQGSYRGLAATANHFARETHMDELARLLKMDALEFRLKNTKDSRLRAVFQVAADSFGWAKNKPAAGHGFGLAGGIEKGGYVATCAEVATDRAGGKVKLLRLVTAFECGAVVNPDHLRNQIEGAMVQGLGGALFETIEFADGRIQNARFSQYRVPRFSDLPQIEIVLIDRKDLPSAGAGETPIVGVAPAVGNAIFDATGLRLRSLPLVPLGWKA